MVKVLTAEQEKEIDRFILNNTIVGAAIGITAGVIGVGVLNRTWPFFKRLPWSIKLSAVGSATVASVTFWAESQNLLYEKVTYGGDPDVEEQAKVSSLSGPGGFADRATEYFIQNKYTVLGGLWAVAAGASVYKLYLNKNITWTQRLVQARMYAQALTVAGLLGVAFISASLKDKKDETKKISHKSDY